MYHTSSFRKSIDRSPKCRVGSRNKRKKKCTFESMASKPNSSINYTKTTTPLKFFESKRKNWPWKRKSGCFYFINQFKFKFKRWALIKKKRRKKQKICNKINKHFKNELDNRLPIPTANAGSKSPVSKRKLTENADQPQSILKRKGKISCKSFYIYFIFFFKNDRKSNLTLC